MAKPHDNIRTSLNQFVEFFQHPIVEEHFSVFTQSGKLYETHTAFSYAGISILEALKFYINCLSNSIISGFEEIKRIRTEFTRADIELITELQHKIEAVKDNFDTLKPTELAEYSLIPTKTDFNPAQRPDTLMEFLKRSSIEDYTNINDLLKDTTSDLINVLGTYRINAYSKRRRASAFNTNPIIEEDHVGIIYDNLVRLGYADKDVRNRQAFISAFIPEDELSFKVKKSSATLKMTETEFAGFVVALKKSNVTFGGNDANLDWMSIRSKLKRRQTHGKSIFFKDTISKKATMTYLDKNLGKGKFAAFCNAISTALPPDL